MFVIPGSGGWWQGLGSIFRGRVRELVSQIVKESNSSCRKLLARFAREFGAGLLVDCIFDFTFTRRGKVDDSA